MNDREKLLAIRASYIDELYNRKGPPDVRWSEYRRELLEQIELIDRLLESGSSLSDEERQKLWQITQGASA